MKFALMYAYNPKKGGPTEEEYAGWLAFDQAVKDAGAFVYEAGFHSVDTAQTLSVRDGKVTTVGGPGTKDDVIAGLYVLEVPALENELKWAQRLPTAQYGKIEVRAASCGNVNRAISRISR